MHFVFNNDLQVNDTVTTTSFQEDGLALTATSDTGEVGLRRGHFYWARIGFLLLFFTLVATLTTRATATPVITEIIDATGDGAGNSLDGSGGIAVDSAGNVYVAGSLSDNAFKITPGGVITEIIDATGDGAGNPLDHPYGIAVDSTGNVYVAGTSSDNAFKITPGGVITEIIDATGDGAGNSLDHSYDIAVDSAGNVYVSGFNSNNAFKITPGGVITEIIDATGDGAGNSLDGSGGIAVDSAGNVYVAGTSSDNAFKITPGGVVTEIIDATGDGAGNILDYPWYIAVNSAGNVYVAGTSSDNAFKITPGGVITEIIDATGDGIGNSLTSPLGIAVDSVGNVYVAGSISDNAFKITPGGVITEIIDTTGDGVGNSLTFPLGIAVDSADNVYVAGLLSNNAFKIAQAATDLSLTKSVNPTTALPGDTITYTLTFSNAGGSTATGVVITDIIPISVTYSSLISSSSGATITPTGSISYAWNVEDLSAGEWGVITITGVLSDPLPAGTFTNIAEITTTSVDSDTSNNSASAGVTVGICSATPNDGGTVFTSVDAQAVRDAIAAAGANGTVKVAGYCAGVAGNAHNGHQQVVDLNKNLTIRGGYTTTNWTASDPIGNPTILDAQAGGRVAWIDGSAGVTIENLSLTNGKVTSTQDGGGIYASGSNTTVVISNSRIYSNTSLDYGGGLYNPSAQVSIENSDFYSNSAAKGGGLSNINSSARMTLTNVSIYSNTFTNQGGGIHNGINARMIIVDSEVAYNSGGAEGGGVYNANGSRLSLSNSDIYGNTANSNGGGVYQTTSSSQISITTNSLIDDNLAADGGGVYVNDGSLTIVDSQVSQNRAITNGGGIYLNNATSQVILTNTDVLTNQANSTASADGGGGAYVNDGKLSVYQSAFQANQALRRGGGIYLQSTNQDSLYVADSTISQNSVSYGAAAANGGGFYILDGEAFITNTTIMSNTSTGGGGGENGRAGAIYLRGNNTKLYVVNSDVWGNSSNGNGGMMAAQDAPTAWFIDTTIIGNSATGSGSNLGNGGAFYSKDGGVQVTLVDSEIRDNEANRNGGGFYLAHTNIIYTLTNTSLFSNTGDEGGGAYVVNGQLRLIDSEVSYNQAKTSYGGALYLEQNSANLRQTGTVTFTYNTAVNRGGALYIDQGQAELDGARVLSNTAVKDGGAFYINNQSTAGLTVTNSCIVYNSDTAVENNSSNDILATGNWWGVSNGPSEFGPGDGDSVSDKVDYSGFLTSQPAGCPRYPYADLAVSKVRIGSGDVTAGEAITYTITITNNGPDTFNATVTDTFSGFVPPIIDTVSGGGACLNSGFSPIICNFSDFTGTQVITLVMSTNPTFGGTLTNTAEIGFGVTAIDPITANNTSTVTATAITFPEMAVLGNGQVINNGDISPSTTDDTDFGTTFINGPITQTFTISNSDVGDLNLIGTPRVDISGSSFFSVIAMPNTPVGSNSTETFNITYNPTAAGSHTATVSIANNDIDENPYTFVISGTGIVPYCFTSLGSTTDYASVDAQALRDAVAAASPGGTVKVAGYCAGVLSGQVVGITKDITVTGGYTHTNWTTFLPDTYTPTLDALGGGRVITINGNIDVLLQNLYVTNGSMNSRGAGLDIVDAKVTISHTTIYSNVVTNGDGGGLATNQTLIVINSTIDGNTAEDDGGGLFVQDANVYLTNSIIQNNRGGSDSPGNDGGGLYLSNSGNVYLDSSQVLSNSTQGEGGGLRVSGNAYLTNTQLINNSGSDGGGMIVYNQTYLTNTQIISNSAEFGGGMLLVDNAALVNVKVISNSAFVGGGMLLAGDTAVFYTSVISNWAEFGGGILNENGTLTLTDSTIATNTADIDGGGILNDEGTLTLNGSSQVTGNTAGNDGGGIYNEDSGEIPTAATVTLNDNAQVIGNTADDDGGGIYSEGSSDSSPVVVLNDNSLISGNEAVGSQGGGIMSKNGAVTLNGNSRVNNNTAGHEGGGISNDDDSGPATLTLNDNSQINSNTAQFGGGVHNDSDGNGATLTLNSNSQIAGNRATTDGGGIYNDGTGGDTALVRLNNSSVISGNQATNDGGGVYSIQGTVLLTGSQIFDNRAATGAGGGVWMGSTMVITGGQIISNSAAITGGGVAIYSGTLTINNTTFSNNQADSGGGLAASGGTSVLINTTLSGNTGATQGGGLYNSGGTAALTHTTISNNTGGGIRSAGGTTSLRNTIVANSLSGNDCSGPLTSNGYNLSGDASCIDFTATGDQQGINPLLSPLADNGGNTQTHALLSGSPAINTATCVAGIATDQRGQPRPNPAGPLCDIGAYESAFAANLQISKTVTPDTDVTYQGQVTYTIVVNNSGAANANNVQITDTLPLSTTFDQWVTQPGGAVQSGNAITWTGTVTAGQAVTMTFVVSQTGDYGDTITNTAYYSYTGSNSSRATFTVEPLIADLSISKSSQRGTTAITYTITVNNAGPASANGATVSDIIPANVTSASWSWTCTPSGGATCTAGGSGDINDTVNLPSGEQAVYLVTATLVNSQVTVVNTATVTAPVGTTDPVTGNNTAVDTSSPAGDIYLPIILKNVSGTTPPVPPVLPDLVIDSLLVSSNAVTVVVRNAGPGTVNDAFWVDVYINPNRIPKINDEWPDLGSQGMVWGLDVPNNGGVPMASGAIRTLTLSSPYYYPGSSSFTIPITVPVYAQVDSINHSTTYGNVLEVNESNNISSTMIILSLSEPAPPVINNQALPLLESGLPPR